MMMDDDDGDGGGDGNGADDYDDGRKPVIEGNLVSK